MREIHLRKLSYDEARQKLEREIHSAFYSGEQFLEIVHGVGGGVIRKMVYEYIQTLDEESSQATLKKLPINMGKIFV